METLNNKRARLRGELLQAYRQWLRAGGAPSDRAGAPSPAEASGGAPERQAEWFDYLEAEKRLFAAHDEQASAT